MRSVPCDEKEEDRDEEQCAAAANEDLDVLQTRGIGALDIKKLKEAGIFTVKGVLMTTRKKLAQIRSTSTTPSHSTHSSTPRSIQSFLIARCCLVKYSCSLYICEQLGPAGERGHVRHRERRGHRCEGVTAASLRSQWAAMHSFTHLIYSNQKTDRFLD